MSAPAHPHSPEVELAVLGAPLAVHESEREQVVVRLLQEADAEDFYRDRNRRIYHAMSALHGRGDPVGVTTLAEELRDRNELEKLGGMPVIAHLVDAVPSAAGLDSHVRLLRKYRVRRELLQATDEADARVRDGASPEELLASLRDRLRDVEELVRVEDGDGLRTAAEILEDPDARIRPATVADHLAWEELVTMLAGREKSGKSTLLRFAVARATAGRRVWTGEPTPAGPREVVYWSEERPVDVAAALERMGADLDGVHVRDMRLDPGDRFAMLRRDLERTEPALLVVDTLATFTDPLDLESGDPGDWAPVMNRFGALAQEFALAVLLNHHARKIDGEYRGSTAIGAGVDAILELRRAPREGPNVRSVTAKARAAADARDFSYELVEAGERPRLELLDSSLSLEERVQRFVQRNEGCGQRDVIDGVRGRGADVRGTLKKLCEDGGPLVEDAGTTPYRYHTRQKAQGNGSETRGKRSGNGGTASEAVSVSDVGGGGLTPPPPSETQAEPVEEDEP